VLVARKGKLKSLPSNAAFISDQLEPCQTLKFKAVKMKLELFDKGDKLNELEV